MSLNEVLPKAGLVYSEKGNLSEARNFFLFWLGPLRSAPLLVSLVFLQSKRRCLAASLMRIVDDPRASVL